MLESGDHQIDVQLKHVEDALLDLGLPSVSGTGGQKFSGNQNNTVLKGHSDHYKSSSVKIMISINKVGTKTPDELTLDAEK